MFTPVSGNELTINVTVEDDDVVEDNVTLTLFLSSEDSSVDVLTLQQQILFIDDDGERDDYDHIFCDEIMSGCASPTTIW